MNITVATAATGAFADAHIAFVLGVSEALRKESFVELQKGH